MLANGGLCSERFDACYVLDFRDQCQELAKAEIDMALLGQLSAFTFGEEKTVRATTKRHPSEGRQHAYLCFQHHGYRVCRKTFTFLHSISVKRLRNLKASLLSNGLTPRCHCNVRRLPPNSICFSDTEGGTVAHRSCRSECHSSAR